MTDTPKFEVIDRRKMKAQEELETGEAPAVEPERELPPSPPAPQPSAGPRLVVEQDRSRTAETHAAADAATHEEPELPPPPTAKESQEQKVAYDASAQRIEEIARAQNPGMGAQPPIGFEHLIQQFYVSALIQMGAAGAQEGQRPQIDVLGARNTIDLLGILAEKTRGNLTPAEDRMLEGILYELRMMFLELTGMITMPNVQQPPPPGKR